jgi:hypothetical protein
MMCFKDRVVLSSARMLERKERGWMQFQIASTIDPSIHDTSTPARAAKEIHMTR